MRRALLALGLAVLVVLAGCGAGGGDRTPESIEATAEQATVGGSALSDAGFTETTLEQVQVERSGTLSISGDVQLDLTYRVEATGWRAVYEPTDGGSGPGTVVALYTVPLAEPERVDATIDPLGDRSLATVVGEAQGVYGQPSALEHVRNRSVTVLGTEATVRQYAATAPAGGNQVDVSVYVTTVEHESDVVRAVAVGPRDADDWATVHTLFGAISH